MRCVLVVFHSEDKALAGGSSDPVPDSRWRQKPF